VALETLKDVDQIDGFKINRLKDEEGNCEIFGKDFISVDHDASMIAFLIQDGPVKEVGVNGCQIDTILKTCYIILGKLNYKMQCQENENAIIHLERAIECLAERKKNREARGVEGTSSI